MSWIVESRWATAIVFRPALSVRSASRRRSWGAGGTLAGAWATLAPIVFVIALASWIVTFALRRVVSLASMVSALVLPLAAALLLGVSDPRFFIAIVVAALLILRHRSNLTRLRKGEERRLDLRGPRSSL